MPIIAISGKHGSGKTTAAKELAKRLRYKYVSAGLIFREMAKKRGLTLEQLSILAENDPSIDKEIDQRTLDIANEEEDIIVDAQLAGWLLKDKAKLSICISASLEKRIERIAKRENRSIDEVKLETLTREKSEKNRYEVLYSYDINDLTIYDIVINTNRLNAQTVINILLTTVESLLNNG